MVGFLKLVIGQDVVSGLIMDSTPEMPYSVNLRLPRFNTLTAWPCESAKRTLAALKFPVPPINSIFMMRQK